MKRNLQTVISDIREGKSPSLLLLSGDDFQVRSVADAVLDLLVPSDRRGFNLERFDGRSTAWDQVEASLMTPPFFPGKKVVWIENAPYFFSREQKGELGEKVLQLWRDGKKDDAGNLLLDLLAVEGWTQERWESLQAGSSSREIVELLEDPSGEVKQDAEGLLAYCRSKGMDLARRRGAEPHRLAEMLDQGLPAWDFLLLTAPQVDRRTRLYKRFDEKGAVLSLELDRDRSGRISRENVLEFLDQRLREAGKTIEPQAREVIVARAGEELRAIHQELEKLLLYVGDARTVRLDDVEEIFSDQGEGWIFDLTKSIADRDAAGALAHLARLMAQGEHPLKLLGTVAGEIRRLLSARQLIETDMRGKWRRGMTYAQFQRDVLQQGGPLVTRNPYADYLCFQRADHFSLRELLFDLERAHDVDRRLKSSGSHARLVMEGLILDMCLAWRGENSAAGRPEGR